MNHTRTAMAHQLHIQIRLFETQNDQISGAPQLGCLADQNQWLFQILTQLCLKHPQSISYDTLKCIKIHINTYYRFIEYYAQYIAVIQTIIDNQLSFFQIIGLCCYIHTTYVVICISASNTSSHRTSRPRLRSAKPCGAECPETWRKGQVYWAWKTWKTMGFPIYGWYQYVYPIFWRVIFPKSIGFYGKSEHG